MWLVNLLSAALKKTVMIHDEWTKKSGAGPAARAAFAQAATPPGPAWALLHGKFNRPGVCGDIGRGYFGRTHCTTARCCCIVPFWNSRTSWADCPNVGCQERAGLPANGVAQVRIVGNWRKIALNGIGIST